MTGKFNANIKRVPGQKNKIIAADKKAQARKKGAKP